MLVVKINSSKGVCDINLWLSTYMVPGFLERYCDGNFYVFGTVYVQ